MVASLRRELAEAAGALDRARAELAEARERTAELEARLRQNPRNSCKPPSSDPPAAAPDRAGLRIPLASTLDETLEALAAARAAS